MLDLIIDSKTKRLRNRIDYENRIYGIFDYILGNGFSEEIPEGHEIVKGEISDFGGMILPKYTKDGWIEDATQHEIEAFEAFSRGWDGKGKIPLAPAPEAPPADRVAELEAAVVELTALLKSKNEVTEQLPAHLQGVVDRVVESGIEI